MKTAINISSTQTSGGTKKLQKSLTDINPNATSAQIVAFAKALNGLTTNTYEETNRIQTINVDTEEVPTPTPTKQTASITLTPTTLNKQQIQQYQNVTFTVDSDYTGTPLTSLSQYYSFQINPTSNDKFDINFDSSNMPAETITVMIPETENYYAATATLTITTT